MIQTVTFGDMVGVFFWGAGVGAVAFVLGIAAWVAWEERKAKQKKEDSNRG